MIAGRAQQAMSVMHQEAQETSGETAKMVCYFIFIYFY